MNFVEKKNVEVLGTLSIPQVLDRLEHFRFGQFHYEM